MVRKPRNDFTHVWLELSADALRKLRYIAIPVVPELNGFATISVEKSMRPTLMNEKRTHLDRNTRILRMFSVLLVFSFLLFSNAFSRAMAEDPIAVLKRPLSASERAIIRKGHFHARRVEGRKGRLHTVGGASWLVLNSTPEQVWRAFRDPRAFQHIIPMADSSEFIRRIGKKPVVRMHHAYGPVDVEYHLALTYQKKKGLVLFHLDNAYENDIRAAWGYLKVKPYTGGRSIVSFGILADIGDGILTGVIRSRVKEWVVKVPVLTKKYVDGWGRHRYRRRS